jgi:fermentation-respiration switch protein FrsA (DUF1100 family)
MWRLGPVCPLLCAALAACGGGSPAARTPAPSTQAVPDSKARALLLRAFHAARAIGREDGVCRGCYPADASEITEDMNARTGDEYAAAPTAFGARIPGVVYVDTTGAGRLALTRITLYARTSNGTIWQLSAARGAPRLSRAE